MDLHTLEATDSWAWPEGAGEYLIKVLRDASSRPEEALLAAELAGDFVVASDAMAHTLTQVLADGRRPLPLRQAAAASLGPMLEAASDALADEYGYDEEDNFISAAAIEAVQDRLQALYATADTPEALRRSVLEASVRDPREWHVAAVRAAYDHPAEAALVSAMFCMGYVRGFDSEILAGLEHDNEDVRYHAVVAAGNAALDEAWGQVVTLATEEAGDKTLRLAAIDALASIRPEETYEVLHDLLDHDDEDIAEAAREALVLAAAIDLEQEEAEALQLDDPGLELEDDPPAMLDPADDGVPPTRLNGHHRS